MAETNSTPKNWDVYNPCQKKEFYQNRISSLEQKRNEYSRDSNEWKQTERTRIQTVCKLAEIIDDALAYEQNHRT